MIRKVGNAQSWDTNKRRDFQNDALIALTAHRHGATVVTANRTDFELLSHEVGISVFLVWFVLPLRHTESPEQVET